VSPQDALAALFLQRERTVVDVTARSGEPAHQPPLPAIRTQLELVCLQPLHGAKIALIYGDIFKSRRRLFDDVGMEPQRALHRGVPRLEKTAASSPRYPTPA